MRARVRRVVQNADDRDRPTGEAIKYDVAYEGADPCRGASFWLLERVLDGG